VGFAKHRLPSRHGGSACVGEAEFVDYECFKGDWASEIVCAMLESEWRAQV
jgi:hypothetical protein